MWPFKKKKKKEVETAAPSPAHDPTNDTRFIEAVHEESEREAAALKRDVGTKAARVLDKARQLAEKCAKRTGK